MVADGGGGGGGGEGESFPDSVAPIEGSKVSSGSANSLRSDDGSLLVILGNKKKAGFRASFRGVGTSISNLEVTYRGSSTTSCSQTLKLRHASSGDWVAVDTRTLSSEQEVTVDVPGDVSKYVASNGTVRFEASCKGKKLTYGADLLRLDFD